MARDITDVHDLFLELSVVTRRSMGFVYFFIIALLSHMIVSEGIT